MPSTLFTTEQGQFALKYILNVNLTDPAQYFFLEWQFYWLNAGTRVHMYTQRKNKQHELFLCNLRVLASIATKRLLNRQVLLATF